MEMKRLVVFLSLFLLTAAESQDLSDKMFTFPVETNTAHVSVSPMVEKISSVTVCLRAFSDTSRNQCLFSLAQPSNDNGFVLCKSKQGPYELNVLGSPITFHGLPHEFNAWNSVCATWDGNTGIAQLWVNGHPSSRKGFKQGGFLTGRPKITLGQEQDSYGGTFDITQSFIGMLTDVHMWDSVLLPEQIGYYVYGGKFQPGNILSWSSLDFSTSGHVFLESKKISQKAGGNYK